ncbi:hypothetical protein FGO68_gene16049 [Halteria grandinella]|uniref:Uncharacterized protein n=1 Tax=Halteria grandinella TaxID=5974 RepID=A0A8J8NMF0_HALGN|nr:hypothetical protein FGO68_gene16049 [Halteria grandinella]
MDGVNLADPQILVRVTRAVLVELLWHRKALVHRSLILTDVFNLTNVLAVEMILTSQEYIVSDLDLSPGPLVSARSLQCANWGLHGAWALVVHSQIIVESPLIVCWHVHSSQASNII